MSQDRKQKKLKVIFFILVIGLIANPVIWDVIVHYTALSWGVPVVTSCTIAQLLIVAMLKASLEMWSKIDKEAQDLGDD